MTCLRIVQITCDLPTRRANNFTWVRWARMTGGAAAVARAVRSATVDGHRTRSPAGVRGRRRIGRNANERTGGRRPACLRGWRRQLWRARGSHDTGREIIADAGTRVVVALASRVAAVTGGSGYGGGGGGRGRAWYLAGRRTPNCPDAVSSAATSAEKTAAAVVVVVVERNSAARVDAEHSLPSRREGPDRIPTTVAFFAPVSAEIIVPSP